MVDPHVLNSFTPAQRLALAYAPARARGMWTGFLALDARLAGIVRATREPLLGQMRLAWWRERLAEPPSAWPAGEPVLALLATWRGLREGLVALVDGWEQMLGEAPLSPASLSAMADGRAAALAALAAELGEGEQGDLAGRVGKVWALADLAARLSHPQEREAALSLLRTCSPARERLPHALRPLAVLHGLARREAEGIHNGPIGALLTAMRLGMFGR